MTPAVIIIGPSPLEMGGMASVVRQMHALDFAGRYRIEPFSTTRSPDGDESAVARLARHIRHLRRLDNAIRHNDARIVHIHTCSGFSFFRSVADMLVAKRSGCRTIFHIHGASFDEFHQRTGIVTQKSIAWSLAHCDCVVALSALWREKLAHIAPDARIHVIENAVALPPVSQRARPPGPCRFLLLARMDHWKGIDDLLDAAAILHANGAAFELTLAGPPGTAGDSRTLGQKIIARGLDEVVRYVGPVEGSDKAELLDSADVYVQPSHHEGMPISLLEALACGLPIVATRVGAVPEVVTEGREGLLVRPHRPDLLADAMRRIMDDEATRSAMAGAARRLAKRRFSLDRFRDEVMALYDEMMGHCARMESRHGVETPHSMARVELSRDRQGGDSRGSLVREEAAS